LWITKRRTLFCNPQKCKLEFLKLSDHLFFKIAVFKIKGLNRLNDIHLKIKIKDFVKKSN